MSARDDLIIAHEGMARSIARRFYSRNSDLDMFELESAALFSLVKRADKFNPEIIPSFGVYARQRINWDLLDYARKKRLEWGREGDEIEDVHESAEADADGAIDIDAICSSLSEADREILRLDAVGMTQREIAEVIGVGHPTVGRRLKTIRQLISQH